MIERALDMPDWARVGEKRRAHIARVTTLLDRWAVQLRLDATEAQAWHDVGRFHDALRDAPEVELRRLGAGYDLPLDVLHGPAAATYLASIGESRPGVLNAVRWHTVGSASWDRVGRLSWRHD